jgi:hypothetical protein
LELLPVGELTHDRRNALETGGLGGAEASLARDEPVAVDRLGDEDRLEDAVLDDALGQRRQVLLIETLSAADVGSGSPGRSRSRSSSADRGCAVG